MAKSYLVEKDSSLQCLGFKPVPPIPYVVALTRLWSPNYHLTPEINHDASQLKM